LDRQRLRKNATWQDPYQREQQAGVSHGCDHNEVWTISLTRSKRLGHDNPKNSCDSQASEGGHRPAHKPVPGPDLAAESCVTRITYREGKRSMRFAAIHLSLRLLLCYICWGCVGEGLMEHG
jgi:hypothetical protein